MWLATSYKKSAARRKQPPTPPKKQKKQTEKATVTIPPAAASWQRKSPICLLFIIASRNLIPKKHRCLLPNEDTNNPPYKIPTTLQPNNTHLKENKKNQELFLS
jgi:hypothetical protein